MFLVICQTLKLNKTSKQVKEVIIIQKLILWVLRAANYSIIASSPALNEYLPTWRRMICATSGYWVYDRRRNCTSNAVLFRLLSSLHFIEHFAADIFCKSGIELLLFYFADVSVANTSPHNLQLLNIFNFFLFLPELLKQAYYFSPEFDELLRGLKLAKSLYLGKVAKLSFFHSYELVNFTSCCPKIA